MWKNRRNARTVAAVGQIDQNDSFEPTSHHVASVVGPSCYPINYSTNGNSNILENDVDSETDSDEVSAVMSERLTPPSSISRVGEGGDVLSQSEHLRWHCAVSGPTDDSFPVTFDTLLDNGSHLAIVNSEWADKLGLKRCKLH
jgi:hypothetical protein